MFVIILAVLFTLFVAYIIYILIPAGDNEFENTNIDAFFMESSDEERKVTQSEEDHYGRNYDLPGRQILILYGTEYGFSEEIAKKLFDKIDGSVCSDEFPWQPRLVNVKHYQDVDLLAEHLLFLIISTAGDGIPPTEARPFYTWLSEYEEDLHHISYSVLALGDSNYPHFCRTGKTLDQRLRALGCQQLVCCHHVDMEDWDVINRWSEQVLACLDGVDVEAVVDYLVIQSDVDDSTPSRNKPFMAKLMTKRNLTSGEDDKETIHCEFDLSGGALSWFSGDALGIYPENNPPEVDTLLRAINAAGDEEIDLPKWAYHPRPDDTVELRSVLMKYYDLKTVRPELLVLLQHNADGTTCSEEIDALLKMGMSKKNTFLHEYTHEREVADVLTDFTAVTSRLTYNQILAQMKALQPRYYSIASSPLVTVDSCWVTAAVVRYTGLGYKRTGVTTTYLQDRLAIGEHCPVFISHNPEFRLPTDPSVPIVMIGPGTGIAPFIAFINERRHTEATGSNWLYFGCRHKDGDFLYKDLLESWAADGIIHLRTAFSRDQAHKVYVQNLIREDNTDLWQLINELRAHVYICGDARHMAKDVHKELVNILVNVGNITKLEAEKYLTDMENTGRYQKDVWVT